MKAGICGLFLATALSLGEGAPVLPAQQMEISKQVLVRFSETCDLPEQLEEPLKLIWEDGAAYALKEYRLEEVMASGIRREVEKEVLYQVEALGEIPDTSSVVIKGIGSRPEQLVSLKRDEIRVRKEHWNPGFQFRVTFHSYGAGYFLLDGEEVVCDDSGPGLYGREEQLLDLIGADSENYRIDYCEWAGQPYEDGDGSLCRDALAVGRKKVRDCVVLYKGTADLPSYSRYRYKKIYEQLQAETEKSADSSLQGEEDTPSLRQKIFRVIRTCLKVTVGLAGILILLYLIHFLRKLARKIDEDRRKEKERD